MNFKKLGIFGLAILGLSGCVFTPHYATGRTLIPGKTELVIGVNNLGIAAVSPDEVETTGNLSPQIGLNVGLPARFELGGSLFFPGFLEGRLRWQATPRDFESFDMSFDGTYGVMEEGFSYVKYGATISKSYTSITPYLFYERIDNVSGFKDDNEDGFIEEIIEDVVEELVDASSNFGFGLEIPTKGKTYFVPEIQYQSYQNRFDHGFLTIGFGIKKKF